MPTSHFSGAGPESEYPARGSASEMPTPELQKARSDEGRPNSATGTRTRVARARAKHPNQLDYSGF